MDNYRETAWTQEDRRLLKRTAYDRHVLPKKLIAEYCPEFIPTMAIVWVSYHESETVDPPPAALQYANDEDGSFAWVATNADALYKQYPDRWILIDKARVVNSASEPEELLRLARTLGIREPFITITTPPETSGKAIYSGQVV